MCKHVGLSVAILAAALVYNAPANPRWMIMAPWEHDYLTWSLHHLVELGYPEAAKCRDYRRIMAEDPIWAIVPGGAAATRR